MVCRMQAGPQEEPPAPSLGEERVGACPLSYLMTPTHKDRRPVGTSCVPRGSGDRARAGWDLDRGLPESG